MPSEIMHRFTTLRGRLAALTLCALLIPLATGYWGVEMLETDVARAAVDDFALNRATYAAASRAEHAKARLDLSLRADGLLALAALQAGASPDVLADYVGIVDKHGVPDPPLHEEMLRQLVGTLSIDSVHASYELLPDLAEWEDAAVPAETLYQVLVAPLSDARRMLFIRHVRDAGLEDVLEPDDAIETRITMRNETLIDVSGPTGRSSESGDGVEPAPGGDTQLPWDVWESVATGERGRPWLRASGEQVTVALTLQDIHERPVGMVWARTLTSSFASTGPLGGDFFPRTRSFLGIVAIGGVIMALAAGYAAPPWVVQGLKVSTGRLYAALDRLRALVARIGDGLRSQARVTGEISASMGELGSSSRSIAETSGGMVRVAEQSVHVARTGDETANAAQTASMGVRDRVAGISDHMDQLGQQSGAIDSILGMIDHLSKETNRLAINAAIAAREAGVAGQPMVSVAEEIGKIAAEGLHSTRLIHIRIRDIQAVTGKTLDETTAGRREVDRSLAYFEQLQGAFERLRRALEDTMRAAQSIERSTSEQSASLDVVSDAIEALEARSTETEADFAEITRALEELSEFAAELKLIWQEG